MVVAPLLAGFTITLMGLVVDASNQGIRYRDTALLLLMSAVAALLGAIQCAYSARRYLVRPDELDAWWPGIEDPKDEGEVAQARELRAEQRAHHVLHLLWASRFRRAYHAGILLLLLGLTVVLIPPSAGHLSPARCVAIAIGIATVSAEAVWIAATSLSATRAAKRQLHKRLVAAARRLVPPYEEYVRWARGGLAAEQLRLSIGKAVLSEEQSKTLRRLLRETESAFSAGDPKAAGARLDELHVELRDLGSESQPAQDWLDALTVIRENALSVEPAPNSTPAPTNAGSPAG
jgi:hypothetical protein